MMGASSDPVRDTRKPIREPHSDSKKLPRLLENAWRDAPAGIPVRVLFQDEARLGRRSDERRCGAPLPVRPIVGRQIVRQFVYGWAAGSPLDGPLSSLVLPWVDTEALSLFLAHTAACFPNPYCRMLREGAGGHRALALRVPPPRQLVSLPPYSPELNPVEHRWDHWRENYLATGSSAPGRR